MSRCDGKCITLGLYLGQQVMPSTRQGTWGWAMGFRRRGRVCKEGEENASSGFGAC